MIILSGGTGTPKLLTGINKVFDEEIKIIVNTAEDTLISGNLVCPNIDSVIYSLVNVIDEEKWWGIKNDSYNTHNVLKWLGWDELMKIGDKDRATHIIRSDLLKNGKSLTEATSFISNSFCIKPNIKILPMTDEPASVRTKIHAPEGELYFQDFWIAQKGKLEVLDVTFEGIEEAKPSKKVMEVLKDKNEKFVIIGPSNPITSIYPILSLKGIKERIKRKKVIAISPIVRDKPISGPAAKFMKAKGFEVASFGVLKCYLDFLNAFIINNDDECEEKDRVKIYKTDIRMSDRKKSEKLAIFLKWVMDEL